MVFGKIWRILGKICLSAYMACVFLKIILGKHCIRNANSVFNWAFKISYHFWSGHDVASLFLADNPYEMELLIKQKLDCFAFFCETVRVNNKLLEKMLKIINIELLKNYFFEKMTVKDLLAKKWSPQFLYRQRLQASLRHQ